MRRFHAQETVTKNSWAVEYLCQKWDTNMANMFNILQNKSSKGPQPHFSTEMFVLDKLN